MNNRHATVEEILARIARLNERKNNLNELKASVAKAFKEAQEARDENVNLRRWNAEDIKVAREELKAARAAAKAEREAARANKPKRKTKAQRAQEEAEAAQRQNNYNEQVRRMREQNEAARRVREEAERVRAAQAASTVTKDQVRAELFADFGLLYGMSAAQLRAVRMAYAKANLAGALGQGSHEKLAFANAILDEMDSRKAARQAEIDEENATRSRAAREAYAARRGYGFW